MSRNRSFKPEEPVVDSFQAFLIDGARFTCNEEYPIIKSDMIAKEVPKKIMPFNKAITFRGDLKDTYICFFAPDESFERVRRNPKRYVAFFKRTAGIIGFDFSIHTDMPMIKQKAQIDDNLSLTYFFASKGIPIIPNVRCGSYDLLDEFLAAIPREKIIAIGTHGFIKTKQERYEWYCFLEKVLDVNCPSIVIVYGGLNDPMYDAFKTKTRFIFYEPWIYNKGKEVMDNGD